VAIRPILRHGAPVLHRKAEPVPAVTPAILELIDDLIATMHAASGVGLAAPQVGLSQRLFVIDLSGGRTPDDLIVLINPSFVRRDGMQLEEEGCLSVPGFHATVARPLHVVVRGLDRQGEERTIEAHGLLARALQHEMDHLDGILFVDRLKGMQRRLMLRRIRKLRQTGQWK
jgi:peptide deformylase